jgi:hypothetical protein
MRPTQTIPGKLPNANQCLFGRASAPPCRPRRYSCINSLRCSLPAYTISRGILSDVPETTTRRCTLSPHPGRCHRHRWNHCLHPRISHTPQALAGGSRAAGHHVHACGGMVWRIHAIHARTVRQHPGVRNACHSAHCQPYLLPSMRNLQGLAFVPIAAGIKERYSSHQ